ncbi:MAG: hypothetical protein HYV09_15620 [Deltaproteobacteria bacterium]|nr:hypothetical protein [Deltaproteobacteria bacterium]
MAAAPGSQRRRRQSRTSRATRTARLATFNRVARRRTTAATSPRRRRRMAAPTRRRATEAFDAPPTPEEADRSRLLDALRRANRNGVEAAKSLGIPKSTFYEKLDKHGIKRG